MKSVCLLLALAALLSLAASQSYLIELPEVYSTSVNITIKSANSLTLLGNYYADQSNLAARLDAVGVHNVQGNITIFAHSTFVDAQRGTGYEIILDNGVFECIQQTYVNPFDVSQLYYQQFVETTYYGTHLVDYVANKSDASGNVATAWVDRSLQIPVAVLVSDNLTYTLAEYDDLDTTVPENIFNLDRLPTACSSSSLSKTRKLDTLAEADHTWALYRDMVDRMFPRDI